MADNLNLTPRVRIWTHRSAPTSEPFIARATVFEAYVGALHILDPGSLSLREVLADLYDHLIQQNVAGRVDFLHGRGSRSSRHAGASNS